jgi:hypothetical protein
MPSPRGMRALDFERALETIFAPAMADFDASAWRPFLRALDGNPPKLNAEVGNHLDVAPLSQHDIFHQCSGRLTPFTSPPRAAQACCGRRSGKTRIAALVAAVAACFWDHSLYLSKGERGRILLLSATRDQASVAKNYVLALLESDKVTKALIDGVSADTIQLTNGIDVVIQAASFRSVRGFTVPLVICDETAFWRDHETSTNPAKEIMRALTPGQSTVPQPLMLSISSPFAKEGAFYETHAKHWGDNESRVLCWQAASKLMNPTLPQEVIDQAYADDPQAAAAEYGGEFRSDIASFIDRDVVLSCIENGRTSRAYLPGVQYHAFCDPSGGSKDSFTLGIAHTEGGQAILDALHECRAPFDPGAATAEIASVLKGYCCGVVWGDRYAAAWTVAEFRKHGVEYRHSFQDRSAIYIACLPLLNSGRAQLLDSTRLVNQLAALQRRTSSSGRQTVDHPRNGADDLANSACGALSLAADPNANQPVAVPFVGIVPRDPDAQFNDPAVWRAPAGFVFNPLT